MSHFGDNLRRIREERNISQKELAIQARLGLQTIEKYEASIRVPDTRTILRLSTVLDVPASELLERESKRNSMGNDTEIEKLIRELGTKKSKLVLRKAKEFSEEDLLRVMQMLDDLKSPLNTQQQEAE
ncbi:helix-turn-helix domain-containing protein [Jeotgalibacillus proteolyticus]|uniref:Transcriptional regulator n=1 Tax=Jeotgalibacillus proteolyticus TaxID=2082395 RepID=A0A2S5G7V3_9BACL|nr:helix-turn-helix transcriptional regulator [Jeotgalibacillus proteolyticus]PPA69058.1 transcriptional regulator [Jeotgalibacillus proteolyticus]